MEIFAEWFKQLLIPGSFSFFLLGTLAALLLLHAGERLSRWGKRWLTTLVVFYVLMATPAIATGLENILQGKLGANSADQSFQGITAIVVLGGGGASYNTGEMEFSVMSESSALRLIEGFRLWEQHELDWIIVSGGDNPSAGLLTAESYTMKTELVELGVPEDHILVESGSANTHDQAVNLQPLFEEFEIKRFLLVTSPTHVRRAYLTFLEAGLEPIPSVGLEHSQAQNPSGIAIVPSLDALDASRNVMREIFGLIYYSLRGWI